MHQQVFVACIKVFAMCGSLEYLIIATGPFAIIKWCTRKEHRKNCVARPICHHDSNDMRVLNKAVIPKSLNESFKDESP